MGAMEFAVKDIRIDVGQIPENVRQMMAASLLKAFRDWKRREAEREKEKAPDCWRHPELSNVDVTVRRDKHITSFEGSQE